MLRIQSYEAHSDVFPHKLFLLTALLFIALVLYLIRRQVYIDEKIGDLGAILRKLHFQLFNFFLLETEAMIADICLGFAFFADLTVKVGLHGDKSALLIR